MNITKSRVRSFVQTYREAGSFKFLLRMLWFQFRKRILGKGIKFKLPTGTYYSVPKWDTGGSGVYYTGSNVDWGSERIFARYMDDDGIFVDVGAHTGYYSLFMGPLVQKVVAFEPDEMSFDVLNLNLAQLENAVPVKAAISDKPGNLRLLRRGRGFSYIGDHSGADTEDIGQSIDVVTIDDAEELSEGRLTGIKIDIDGHDFAALKGGSTRIARDQPLVLIEFGMAAGSENDPDQLFDLTDALGYQVCAFHGRYGSSEKTLKIMNRESLQTEWIKMLFLVPQRLQGSFREELRA